MEFIDGVKSNSKNEQIFEINDELRFNGSKMKQVLNKALTASLTAFLSLSRFY